MLQYTYLHVCAICNVCVDLVVVVVVVVVIPATTHNLLQIMIKVQSLQQMFDSIFKIHFPVVVIVIDVVGDIDNGVDGRNNETKETKRGHPILRYTLCLSLLFIMFMIKVMVMLIDMVLLIVLIMVRSAGS